MKPLPQFFALLRFHACASPWIWVFPIAFGMQPIIHFWGAGNNWGNLTIALLGSNMMWITPILFAATVFIPELFVGMQGTTPQTHPMAQGFSAEFLLTRAVDRPVIFRSRVVFYWILALIPVLVLLALAAWRPSISIEIPLKSPGSGAMYLQSLPGAFVAKTTKTTEVITSPTGRLAIAGTLALVSVLFTAFGQGFVFAISRFKFKRWIFYTVFIGGIVSPILLMFANQERSFENLIFLILNHPVAAVGLTGLFVGAAWLFSSARAKMIEYP